MNTVYMIRTAAFTAHLYGISLGASRNFPLYAEINLKLNISDCFLVRFRHHKQNGKNIFFIVLVH